MICTFVNENHTVFENTFFRNSLLSLQQVRPTSGWIKFFFNLKISLFYEECVFQYWNN